MNHFTKSYNELKTIQKFEERLEYLRCNSGIGIDTFGYDRYLNQMLYSSSEWKKARREVLLRDNCCDLGIEGYEIFIKPVIHHINPITVEQIKNFDPIIFDLNNLITTTHNTHNAIHYGTQTDITRVPFIRTANDTCPWRK